MVSYLAQREAEGLQTLRYFLNRRKTTVVEFVKQPDGRWGQYEVLDWTEMFNPGAKAYGRLATSSDVAKLLELDGFIGSMYDLSQQRLDLFEPDTNFTLVIGPKDSLGLVFNGKMKDRLREYERKLQK